MARRPAHRTTTRHVAAAYPWLASPGLGTEGTYIGTDVYGGGPYVFDPWVQYKRTITGPNFTIIGSIGSGKSSLLKTLMLRSTVFGRKGIVIDMKGEYAPLAEAVGGAVVRVQPPKPGETATATLNVLDRDLTGSMKVEMLMAVAGAVLRRPIGIEEAEIIRETVDLVDRSAIDQPVLRDVWQQILDPPAETAKALYSTQTDIQAAGREVGLALRSLSGESVAGMFDGASTVQLDPNAPITVMDLSGVVGVDDQLMRIVMVMASSWIQSVWARKDGQRRYVIIDEAHRIMREVALLRWLSVAAKLARQYQTALGFSMHRYSDLISGDADGTETVKIAKGLLADCEVRICYRQNPDELPLVRDWAGLSEMETTLVGQLSPGEGIWRVGSLAHRVRHRRGDELEHRITDTDSGQSSVDEAARWVRETVASRYGGTEARVAPEETKQSVLTGGPC